MNTVLSQEHITYYYKKFSEVAEYPRIAVLFDPARFARRVREERIIDSDGEKFLVEYLTPIARTYKKKPKADVLRLIAKGAWAELLMTGRVGKVDPPDPNDFLDCCVLDSKKQTVTLPYLSTAWRTTR